MLAVSLYDVSAVRSTAPVHSYLYLCLRVLSVYDVYCRHKKQCGLSPVSLSRLMVARTHTEALILLLCPDTVLIQTCSLDMGYFALYCSISSYVSICTSKSAQCAGDSVLVISVVGWLGSSWPGQGWTLSNWGLIEPLLS